MRRGFVRWIPWLVFGVFVALMAYGQYLERLVPSPEDGDQPFLVAGFLLFAGTGAFLASRVPGNPIGWIFLLAPVGVGLGFVGDQYGQYATRIAPGSLPAPEWVAWLSGWTWVPSIGLVLTFLFLLFPNGRLPSRRWRPVAWYSGALLTVSALIPALAEGPISHGIPVENPLGIIPSSGILHSSRFEDFLAPFLLVAVGLSASSLVFRYRRAAREERQQLKWFLFVAVFQIASLAISESFLPDVVDTLLFVLMLVSIPAAVAVAVLRYRLYDIDVVINKTVVYGALAAFITAIYVGVVVGLGSVIGTRGEPHLGLQIGATALVAVAFQPARARLQRFANRLVFGKRATPYEVMSGFAAQMSGVLGLEEVLPRMAEAAASGVGAVRARVTVRLPGGDARSEAWPAEAGQDPMGWSVPVLHRGEEVGDIAVAKAPGDPLRPGEEALLRDLAGQAGVALHNVQLAAELRARLREIERQASEIRASRRRIVVAQEEERRRLEEAISRGVGERLADMERQLARAESMLTREAEEAATLLDSTAEEARRTLEELREIARGIYPPLLADRGLPAALEAQGARSPIPVSVNVDEVGRFGEDIEGGVYFCFLEALGQALAEGKPLRLRLSSSDDHLHLDLDGPTIEGDTLLRIRDRVEGLGGTLEREGGMIRAKIPARELEAV